MWKRSFTFLVALALVLSSLSAHPGWLYGKKAADPTPVTVEAPTTLEPTDLTTPEAHEPASIPEETPLSVEPKEPGEALRLLLTESNLDEAVLEAVFSYLDMVDAGIETMTEAYEAEVASHEETEARYNNLVENGVKLPKKALEIFASPYGLYDIKTGTFGVGVTGGVSYGRYGLTLGVVKPSVPTLGSLKNLDEYLVTAGFVFKF